MKKQTTLKYKVSYLINQSTISFVPAFENSGIIVHNYNTQEYIKLDYSNLIKAQAHNMILRNNKIKLQYHHNMILALYICGINNVFIHVSNNLIPPTSINEVVFLLESAGKITQA